METARSVLPAAALQSDWVEFGSHANYLASERPSFKGSKQTLHFKIKAIVPRWLSTISKKKKKKEGKGWSLSDS